MRWTSVVVKMALYVADLPDPTVAGAGAAAKAANPARSQTCLRSQAPLERSRGLLHLQGYPVPHSQRLVVACAPAGPLQAARERATS